MGPHFPADEYRGCRGEVTGKGRLLLGMTLKFSEYLYKISRGWVLLAALLIFLFFMAWVLPEQAASAADMTGDTASPDLSLYYNPSQLHQMAAGYGEMGRKAYIKARFTFDLVYPLVYAVFLALAISCLLAYLLPAGNAWRRLNLLPVCAALFDFLENIAASLVMVSYPEPLFGVAGLAGIFTLVKWLLITASFLVLAGAALGLAFCKLKKAV